MATLPECEARSVPQAGRCRGDERSIQVQLDVVRSERQVDRDADVIDGSDRNRDVRKPSLALLSAMQA